MNARSTFRIFAITGTLAVVSLVVIQSCKKIIDEKVEASKSMEFNATAAKEWYYGKFKKTAEFRLSSESGKKLPDWNHGVYRKVEGMEIVEFPLLKSHDVISIPATAAASPQQIQQLVNGALSRAVFIKKPDGRIFLREVYYMPTYQFLAQKNQDISEVHLGLWNSGGFCGRILIKKWDGAVVSLQLMRNGKLDHIGRIVKTPSGSANLSTAKGRDCEIWETCEYERYCTDYYSGDVWIKEECTDWAPTGFCWLEEFCEPEKCDYGSNETCECQLYGLGCGPDGGGDFTGDCANQDEKAYQIAEQEFKNYIEEKGVSEVSMERRNNWQPQVFVNELLEWNIVEHIFNTWSIRAKVHVQATHDNVSMNDNATLSLDHKGSYYVGSNNLVVTTWTEDPVEPAVIYKNHTPNPWGYYYVSGLLVHKIKGDVTINIGPCSIKISPVLESQSKPANVFKYYITK